VTRPDAPDRPDKPEDAVGAVPRAGTGGAGPAHDGPDPVADEAVGDAADGGRPERRRAAVGVAAPALALVAGLVAGFLLLPSAPGWLAPYLPVAVVTALDALVGGLRAALERVFDDLVFVASLLTNTVVAVLLVLVGERLGVGGALTTAVVIVFGIRIFTNATALRRHLFGV
jgi:small basic protein